MLLLICSLCFVSGQNSDTPYIINTHTLRKRASVKKVLSCRHTSRSSSGSSSSRCNGMRGDHRWRWRWRHLCRFRRSMPGHEDNPYLWQVEAVMARAPFAAAPGYVSPAWPAAAAVAKAEAACAVHRHGEPQKARKMPNHRAQSYMIQ